MGHRVGLDKALKRGDLRELILQAEPHAAAALDGVVSGELRPRIRCRPPSRRRRLGRGGGRAATTGRPRRP
eukprot:1922736-Alexandrium_andersonii.AAC.1